MRGYNRRAGPVCGRALYWQVGRVLGWGWLSTSVKSKCWFEGGVLVDSRGLVDEGGLGWGAVEGSREGGS